MNKELSKLENKHKIDCRWTINSEHYQCILKAKQQQQQQNLLRKLQLSARERWYLLQAKAKFAGMFNLKLHYYLYMIHLDGQAIASRLSHAVTKESSKLRKLLAEYNKSLPNHIIDWEEITDLSTHIHQDTQPEYSNIPRTIRLEAISLYHHQQRANEEILMLQDDMQNVINYHMHERERYKNMLSTCSERGRTCLIKYCIIREEVALHRCHSSFGDFVSNFPEFTSSFEEFSLSKELPVHSDSADCDSYSSSTSTTNIDDLIIPTYTTSKDL